MKKIFFKLSLVSLPLTFCFIGMLLYCILVDPHNVFHYKAVRDNGVEPNKNYIKTRYVLDNPNKFDSYLFGNSRVYWINAAAFPKLHCYNMGYSNGIPKEHLESLEVFIKNNIIPNTAIIGIDEIACCVKPEEHKKDFLRMPYPKEAAQNNMAYYPFLLNYINLNLLPSIKIVFSHKGDNTAFRKQFYENGGVEDIAYENGILFDFKEEEKTAKSKWKNTVPPAISFHYGIKNAITDIQSIIDLCKEHNIKLILFTQPLSEPRYQKAVELGYISFLMQLSEITDYYNFSSINDITSNEDYFLDTVHYNLNVGYLIIDAIFNNKNSDMLLSQGFGYYVTPKTKAAFFDLLQKQQVDLKQ